MRAAVGFFALLCLTARVHAQDTGPAPAAATPSAATPSDSQLAAKPPAEQGKAVNPTAATPTTQTTKTASSEFTPEENNLLRHGYRLQVRNGERRFCRDEDTLGSRLHAHKVCGSVESLTRRVETNTNQVRDNLQTTVIGKDPLGH